jgi:hypothetical protein
MIMRIAHVVFDSPHSVYERRKLFGPFGGDLGLHLPTEGHLRSCVVTLMLELCVTELLASTCFTALVRL